MKKRFVLLLLPLASAGQSKYAARLMQAEERVNQFNGKVLVVKSGKIIYQKALN